MVDREQDLNQQRNDENRLLELQGFGRLKQSRSNKRDNQIQRPDILLLQETKMSDVEAMALSCLF